MRYKVLPEERWVNWWKPLYIMIKAAPIRYVRSKQFKLHRSVMRLKRRYWSEVYWEIYTRKGRIWRGVICKRKGHEMETPRSRV